MSTEVDANRDTSWRPRRTPIPPRPGLCRGPGDRAAASPAAPPLPTYAGAAPAVPAPG